MNARPYLVSKVESMIKGKSVILSNDDLDFIQSNAESFEIHSFHNPRQLGTKDQWLCWIGDADTVENVFARLAA